MIFTQIASLENLFISWQEFQQDKIRKNDVLSFSLNLEKYLFDLHDTLQNGSYHHAYYTSFYINDPKPRHIFKACVRDRIVHHAVYRILYPIFDRTFIYDSYSCRSNKGIHRAINRIERFAKIVSQNNTRPCFALKCDIQKFFSSVDHNILFRLIQKKVREQKMLALLWEIISSYSCENYTVSREKVKGLPIGNLTSQLFANIYLNAMDHYLKDCLRIKFYLRYCDDFIILDNDLANLRQLVPMIENHLESQLKLKIHPRKINFRKLCRGVDFCGYNMWPYHRLLRTKTKRRMLKNLTHNAILLKKRAIASERFDQSFQSYLGLLKHCDSYKLKTKLSQGFKLLFDDID